MKKLLLAAILFLVMATTSVQAQPAQYQHKSINQVNVVVDVGYWIEIETGSPLKVTQEGFSGTSFAGCTSDVTVTTNFAVTLSATVESSPEAIAAGLDAGPNGAQWLATINGGASATIQRGITDITMCVAGTSIRTYLLPPGDNTPIAVITIEVVPAN